MNQDDTWTLPGGIDEDEERETPNVLAGRYALGRPLGSGGFGVVWEARDLRLEADVAVKLLSAVRDADLARVRREVGALRWLHLPGVVHLRDDGLDRGQYFIVMDLLPGSPFPGGPVPMAWNLLRSRALALLETLAGVHHAGIVHRDLKPGNVLVRSDGRPFVLDFGLALVQSPGSGPAGPLELTPEYGSPEQFLNQPADARTDLYALGVMLFHALSGVMPHGKGDWREIRERRLGSAAPRLRSVAPRVPADVAEVVDMLLARDPEDRPGSALTVIELLGGSGDALLVGPAMARLPADRPATAVELEQLFQGPDYFTHVAEDASASLLARTGGERARVLDELARWCRAGLAHWEGDALAVDRRGLDRMGRLHGASAGLQETPAEEALRLGLARGKPAAELLPLAERAGERLLGDGQLERAFTSFQLALGLARQDAAPVEVETRLLARLCEAALAQEARPAMEAALVEVERSAHGEHSAIAPIRWLLLGVRASYERNAEAARILDALDTLPSPELEIWRQAARVRVASGLGPDMEEALLDLLERWAAGDQQRQAKLWGWRGNLRYRQLLVVEAAQLHERSGLAKRRPDARLASLSNAAGCWLEALDFDRARELAEVVVADARALRRSAIEVSAAWILRQVAYRRGLAGAPRLDLVEAASRVDAPSEGLFALSEGAVAWRRGMSEAGELAHRAAACFRVVGLRGGALLAEALAGLIEGIPPQDADRLASAALSSPFRSLAVQTLGLLRLAGVRSWDPSDMEALAASRPRSQWGVRLEVLSFREALGLDSPRMDK